MWSRSPASLRRSSARGYRSMGRAEPSFSLQARLESAFAGASPKRTVIGLRANARRRFAAFGSCATRAEAEPFRVGCATKLLVAALLERKIRMHGVDYDAPVRRMLDVRGAAAVGETTLRHLL